MTSFYRIAANAMLALHALYVLFVIIGFVLTVVGGFRGWNWVRNFWFRILHLASIGIVVFEVFAKLDCPLTVWEQQLRKRAGDPLYETDFISHWMAQVVPVDISPWVFAVIYVGFALAVASTWWCFPPRRPSSSAKRSSA